MGQIRAKTEKIWPTENSGNFVNRWKRILNLIQKKLHFQKKKTYAANMLRMAGYIIKNMEDSLANVPSRKGIFYSEPLIADRAAEIRSEGE